VPGSTVAVVVEGGDEVRLVQAIVPALMEATRLNLTGRNKDKATGFAKDPQWRSVRHVAVVLDNEEDPGASLAFANQVLLCLGPTPVSAAGAVEVDDTGRRGVWLLPEPGAAGAQETLLRRAAPKSVAVCVDALFQCAPLPSPSRAQADKAWVGAWLSTQCVPARPDQGWEQGVFDARHAAFDPLRSFLLGIAGS
jgi:hypothetical protein